MTFAELKTQLQALGYGTDTDTVQGLFINEAYRRIGRKRPWSWLRASAVTTMIPGTIEYTWTDFGISSQPPRRLESARVIDASVTPNDVWKLRWLEPAAFNDVRGGSATTWPASERQLPGWWTRIGATGVAVWSPPDLGYTFHLSYTKPVAVLSGVGEPEMPRDYHDAIVFEAAYQMAMRSRDQVAMAAMGAERDEVLAQLEAEDSLAQLHDYERIGEKQLWTQLERRY